MAIFDGTEKFSKCEAQAEIILNNGPRQGIIATIQLRITSGSFRHSRVNVKLDKDNAARLREALTGEREKYTQGSLEVTIKGDEVTIEGEVVHTATNRTIPVIASCRRDRLDGIVEKLPNHYPDGKPEPKLPLDKEIRTTSEKDKDRTIPDEKDPSTDPDSGRRDPQKSDDPPVIIAESAAPNLDPARIIDTPSDPVDEKIRK